MHDTDATFNTISKVEHDLMTSPVQVFSSHWSRQTRIDENMRHEGYYEMDIIIRVFFPISQQIQKKQDREL